TRSKTKDLQCHHNFIFILSNFIYTRFIERSSFINLLWVNRFFVTWWSHSLSESLIAGNNHGKDYDSNCNDKPYFFITMQFHSYNLLIIESYKAQIIIL